MKQNNTILQWNCKGIRANYEELQQLLTNHNPKIACLQETFLKESRSIWFKQYPYNHFNKDGNRTSGGVSILIRKDLPQSQIHIDTNLQTIIVKATLRKPIQICSIYIPPHNSISDIKMNKLLHYIPKPYLLLGDLNSHNTVWGCQKTPKKRQRPGESYPK